MNKMKNSDLRNFFRNWKKCDLKSLTCKIYRTLKSLFLLIISYFGNRNILENHHSIGQIIVQNAFHKCCRNSREKIESYFLCSIPDSQTSVTTYYRRWVLHSDRERIHHAYSYHQFRSGLISKDRDICSGAITWLSCSCRAPYITLSADKPFLPMNESQSSHVSYIILSLSLQTLVCVSRRFRPGRQGPDNNSRRSLAHKRSLRVAPLLPDASRI